jgi:hypothetical protein
MCKFFSFVSDPTWPLTQRFRYFNWEQRQDFLKGKIQMESPDSHTSIAYYLGYTARMEDKLNKYEYNPLTGVFTVDQINNNIDDRDESEKWVRGLDFAIVVAPLIIKPIIHPFKIQPPEITPEVLELLKQWASVGNSVWDSVRASVGNSVWDSVRDSVRASVGNSVRASVGNSVRDSVRDSVRASVGNSVWDSVWDSVRAYISSFITIEYKYDLSPAIKLWEMGLVPVFDGKVWKLCGGKKGQVLWEGVL